MQSPAAQHWRDRIPSETLQAFLHQPSLLTKLIFTTFTEPETGMAASHAASVCEGVFFSWLKAVDVKPFKQTLIDCLGSHAHLERSLQVVFYCEHAKHRSRDPARISVFTLSMPQILAWATVYENPKELPCSVAQSVTSKVSALLEPLNPMSFNPSFQWSFGLQLHILPEKQHFLAPDHLKDLQRDLAKLFVKFINHWLIAADQEVKTITRQLVARTQELREMEANSKVLVIVTREGPFPGDRWGGEAVPGSCIASLTQLTLDSFSELFNQKASEGSPTKDMLSGILDIPISQSDREGMSNRYDIMMTSDPRFFMVEEKKIYFNDVPACSLRIDGSIEPPSGNRSVNPHHDTCEIEVR